MTRSNTRRISLGLAVLCSWFALGDLLAQLPPQAPLPPPPINQSDDPLLRSFRWRAIGPASMGGRIDDIVGVESDPSVLYVGAATGGVWKTVNAGTTWAPIFDTYPTSSIGDIAVSQSDPNIVWVGTGEPNNRQSSSFGDGIYKSVDGGKKFTNMGLNETQTIARIVIDPRDNNTVYAAAVGHLFGPNPERGIYKTTDGGNTWTKIKFIDEDAGFTDLVMDPTDNKVLYAASYQRRRTPWGFNGGGPGCGIWKTIDAGKTWTKLTGNGLPTGPLGRIGLDVSRSNPNVVFAQIEVGYPPAFFGAGGGLGAGQGSAGRGGPQAGQAPSGGQAGAGAGGQAAPPQPPNPGRSGVWRSDDKGKTWRLMSNNNNRPMYYSQIRVDPSIDQIVYTMGAPFHKSTDDGKTFQVVQGIAHSDHHAMWIDPKNPKHLVLGNDGGIDVSWDQGETWDFINTIPLAQFYAIGVDMRKPYYVYGGLQDNGSWGGPSATRSALGITNADWFRIGGGDGFYVQIDPTDHNTVYAESQNGALNRLDIRTGRAQSIRPRAASPPRGQGLPGSAGAEPQPEQPPGAAQAPADPSQFGFFRGSPTSNIVPAPPVGEQFRFNWSTPVHLSPHNPRTVYVGANKLFKSVDRGDTWTASPDLTKQVNRDTLAIMGVPGDKPMSSKHDGTSTYGNITTIAESPVVPGVLWVGTDDGNVQLSRDGGATWTNVAESIEGVPKTHQISRVEPSHFDAATCYISIDGHRSDDHKPYVWVTTDYGKSWKFIAGNLPPGNVNVIREDPKSRNLLYLGTEQALYVSLNGGQEWKRFMTGLPTVRIDDIVVHPRDNDLIAGTHGRGIYIVDDITPLQQLSDKVLQTEAHLFDLRAGTQWLTDVTLSRVMGGARHFRGANPLPGTAISYFLKSAATEDVKITVSDIHGKVVRNLNGSKDGGINRVQWDLRGDPPPRPPDAPPGFGRGRGGFGALQGPAVEPGIYRMKVTIGSKELATTVRVLEDTR